MKPSEFSARTGHKTAATLTATKSPTVTQSSVPTRSETSIGTSTSAGPRRIRDSERGPVRPQEPLDRSAPFRRAADCYRPGERSAKSSDSRDHPEPIRCSGESYRPDRAKSPAWPTRHDPNLDSSCPKPSTTHPPRERGHISAEEQIKRMPIGKPGEGAMITRNKYFWNPGEVLAHLYFGPDRTYLGAARVCNVTLGAKNEVLASKPRQQKLEL